MPHGLFVVLRLASFGLFFFTSLYCVLTFVPFTHTHVIEAGIFPWLAGFTRVHKWLFAGASTLVVVTLWPDFKTPKLRVVVAAYALVLAALSVAIVAHPVLPTLGPDDRSLRFGLAALGPAVGLALVDHLAAGRRISWSFPSTREDVTVLFASLALLGLAFLSYTLTFHVRAASGLGLERREEALGLGLSLLLHSAYVGAAFAGWCLVRALATFTGRRAVVAEHVLLSAAFLTALALLVRDVVFVAISLRGPIASVIAFWWATAIVLTLSGIAWRGAARRARPVHSGVRLFFSALSPAHMHRIARLVWLAAVLALAVRLQVVASRMDVNGLMQKLCACFSWVMIFAATLALFRRPSREAGGTVVLILSACLGMLAYRSWRSFGRPADQSPILEKIAAADPSYGLLYDLSGAGGKSESMGERFDLMQRNTGFPREHVIEPLAITFAHDLGTAPGPKPHVFIFVVDSLRRDYVSPFNSKVTFTPSLAKFAQTSDVFTNAFTHYGATGLSEPSIWVGGMMPHKQYITPFTPMNSLEKLLVAERYQRMVSVDSILAQILDKSSLIPLDEGKATGDFDLCQTLEELRGKIDARKNQGIRMFAYTQAQNIHVSTIAREAASVPPGVHFEGFYDPYASRLQRIDACFGKFLDYLEREGLYEESIVVFTADHGDLLGEEGRWGHAYNLNPEVVRIPLIIHRPAQLRGGLTVDPSRIAFSTDIAPSLYRLLGYMPTTLGGGFGQSLYGPRGEDREWHMLVSSYGPVYGILEEAGSRLYVADAVNYTDAYFDVAAGSSAARDSVPEDVRTRCLDRIAAGIADLHETFHVKAMSDAPQGTTAPSASGAEP